MLGGWSVFRHMSCFGWAWPKQPTQSLPSGLIFRPGMSGSQGGAVWQRAGLPASGDSRGALGCRWCWAWRSRGRRRVRVVLSAATYTRQCSAVLWVGSVLFVWSCVFWGILKLTAALSPESLLLPFQTASWVHLLVYAGARGLCHPRPPTTVPFPSGP